MLNCEPRYPFRHTNRFICLHGVPYLVGEYVDRTRFDPIDDTTIGNGITIDQCDPLRTIIDIQLSDIERRNSDGRLSTVGNSSKLSNMIDIIKHNWDRTEGHLRVLRNGLVIRVYYQIENGRTGIVLRSMNESFRIDDANYFVYINPEDISDNSLITNYSDSKITSVAHFTYGRDPMVLRVTDVQMFYEVTEMDPMKPRVERRYTKDSSGCHPYYGPDPDAYYYHQKMQSVHNFEPYNWRNDRCQLAPENWTGFNRFYHYDEEDQSFLLHFDQIYDRRCKIIQLACGKIKLNRTFIVNPGTRLVFKFCIWKNDSIIANNCARIADALRIPPAIREPVNVTNQSTDSFIPYNPTYDFSTPLPNIIPPHLQQSTSVDYAQNKVINQLIDVVTNLELKVAELAAQSTNTNSGSNSQGTQELQPSSGGSNEPTESEHTTSDERPESNEDGAPGVVTPDEPASSTDPNTDASTTPDDGATEPSGENGSSSQGSESTDPDPDSNNNSETP